MFSNSRKWATLDASPQESRPIPIVSDAAIATRKIGHGRLIPLLILDTSQRPDVIEVVAAQEHVEFGEVSVQWATLENRFNHFALIMSFDHPIRRTAVIEFNISTQGSLVEQIFQSGALYIQPGIFGERFSSNLNRPKMMVEVGETHAKAIWDRIYLKSIIEKFRNDGMGRKEARRKALEYLEQTQDLGSRRFFPT